MEKSKTSDELEKADFFPKNNIEKVDLSAKTFTTKPKQPRRHKSKTTRINENSIAKSRLFSIEQKLGLTGLFDGKVYHLSFDCPKNLAELFKEATKANGTSVCKELQNYALTYVVNYGLQKSAFGSTLSRALKPKLTVQNLNVTQYVQSRPRRLVRNVEPQMITPEGKATCEIGQCVQPAVESGIYQKDQKTYRLCEFHSRELSKTGFWRIP